PRRRTRPARLDHHRPGAQRPRAHLQMNDADNSPYLLFRLADTLATCLPARGGGPDASYSAKLLARRPDACLEQIGDEATQRVRAAKDSAPDRIVYETADLWFHSLIALTHYNLRPEDVLRELARREGTSGLAEKASRGSGSSSHGWVGWSHKGASAPRRHTRHPPHNGDKHG